MGNKKFIFVGGLERSGTSLLFRCLREHPSISGFKNTPAPEDEGQFLQTVFPTHRHFGTPGRYGFHPEAPMTENSALCNPDSARELFRQWKPHWDLSKPYLLEKSPINLLRTRFLQGLFPSSTFVICIRDPIAVSLATQRWAKTTMSHLLSHWVTCYRIFERDKPFLRRCIVIRYENLTAHPRKTMNELFRFLGLAPVTVKTEIKPGLNLNYLEYWRGLWDHPTQGAHCGLLMKKWEAEVRPFGYTLRR